MTWEMHPRQKPFEDGVKRSSDWGRRGLKDADHAEDEPADESPMNSNGTRNAG